MEQNPYLDALIEKFRSRPEMIEFLKALRWEFFNLQRPAEEIFLDDVDLRKYLKVSARTTATYRSEELIHYSKVGGRVYYKLSEVIQFVDRHRVESSLRIFARR